MLVCSLALVACGQKGALYLPAPGGGAPTPAAATAASSAASAGAR
ncbi:LPS translocon maturation chaperone LptM [Methylibium sp.]|nr:lipoprotein [Methylibium sp.]